MARKKKITDADIAKMRDIETYEHSDKQRFNNPPAAMAQHDTEPETIKTYQYDPHLDPMLQWAGKAEGQIFDVPTSSIHIHESIKPHKIIRAVQAIGDDYEDNQPSLFPELFETPVERMRRRRDTIEFYKHGVDWTNRLIAGDSLVIMNSMLEKEGMSGQVQMMYFDPPYGIKYSSNFQPFVNKKDVKDKKDDDLDQTPEMITAFRDTWELGIHSYLSYIRNRLYIAKELLADEGSVFIQISDENVHHIREVCDEVFGPENFVSQIIFRKKQMPLGAAYLENTCDFIVWYAKDKNKVKFHQLFKPKEVQGDNHWNMIELPDGSQRKMTREELNDHAKLPNGAKIFRLLPLYPAGFNDNALFPVQFNGKEIYPPRGKSWKTSEEGMRRLIQNGRVTQYENGDTLQYVAYLEDYNISPIMDLWIDTAPPSDKVYSVQTARLPIQRCLLMTTDPGDLVLDITCGSGTTAFVAEQWGRRWITCDTSRVAIALAKQRLMTAVFDYYKLNYDDVGISGGLQYQTAPHITLGSIANNENPPKEVLYDQPIIDKNKIRVSGPFTVEALPAPVVKPLDNALNELSDETMAKQSDWRDELLATGILGRHGERIEFSRVEQLEGTQFLQASAETKGDDPQHAVVCFASETQPMDSRMVAMALDEAENLRPSPKMIIFAAFQFDPEAAKEIDETNWPGKRLLKVQMNTDLMTADLKKKRSSSQSFLLVGEPDVELVRDGRSSTRFKVIVKGFDYYNVKTGIVESGNANRIAMWMLDTDYDGMCIEPMQVFFPMGGKSGGWNRLAKTLKAEIDQDLICKYAGNESLWFTAQPNSQIAIKIVDDRGIESLKVIKIGGEA